MACEIPSLWYIYPVQTLPFSGGKIWEYDGIGSPLIRLPKWTGYVTYVRLVFRRSRDSSVGFEELSCCVLRGSCGQNLREAARSWLWPLEASEMENRDSFLESRLNPANNQWAWKRTFSLKWDWSHGWHLDFSLMRFWAKDPANLGSNGNVR